MKPVFNRHYCTQAIMKRLSLLVKEGFYLWKNNPKPTEIPDNECASLR